MPSKITPDSPALSASAPDRLGDWQARLVETGRLPADLDAAALAAAVAASGRRMTTRIGLALLQEGILEPRPGGNAQTIDISAGEGQDSVLLMLGLSPEMPSLFPEITFQRQDGEGNRSPVDDPVELLFLIAPLLGEAAPEDLMRLAEEVADAQLNDALCAAYRALNDRELVQKSVAAGCMTFRDWILCREEPQDPIVLLEQWSAVGHPYHPTHKTRRGMSPGEALSCCPEFRPRVQVRLAAVRKERLQGESLPEGPAKERWLDHYFPAAAEAWRAELTAQGFDPEDYAALPLHPWQAEHAIPARFARSLAEGDLVLLAAPQIPADPLVSVRTLAAATGSEAPHLTLSLGVRLTSVERTIPARSCEMGPRISRLLQDLTKRDEALSRTLDILPEEVGLYFASAHAREAEQSKHLAAILRGHPAPLCGAGGIVVHRARRSARSEANTPERKAR